MSSKPVFLDVDSSICENNYLIAKDKEEEEFKNYLASQGLGQLPPKIVKPTPGFCIKTRELNSDKKIFINICQTDSIPPPKSVTENELEEILSGEDITDFRVPMSIGDLHKEPDKKGEESTVCDIAINPQFYQKVIDSYTFKMFFMAVAFEGFSEKFKIKTTEEKTILKNKKAMGTLQVHRIRQDEIDEKMGKAKLLPTVDEILKRNEGKAKIEVIADLKASEPKYRLFMKKEDKETLYMEVHLPYLTSSKNVILDVGEDRVILESIKANYFLDIFHNYTIDQNNTKCTFHKDTKFLTITMPIKNC